VRKTILTGLLSTAAVVLAGCSAAREVQSVTVQAQDLAFSPTSITVTAGQPVVLTLENSGALEHDLSILEFPVEGQAQQSGGSDHSAEHGDAEGPDLHVSALAGQSVTLEFTPSKPGTYEFWCMVAGHKEAGMTGTLIVQAPES
jgi:uncharacterized cupredoxin-like copper-binding protein